MDFPDQLRANGLPFVSKTFRVDSRLVSQAALEFFSSRWVGRHRFNPGFTGSYQHDVIPLHLDVMNFPTDTLLICLLHKEIPVTMRVVC